MATYLELFAIRNNGELRNRVAVACVIAAEAIRVEQDSVPNHANRLVWSKAVFANPLREAERMLWAVLAQNAGATQAAILGATDAAVLTAVNTAVNVFATGE